MYFKPGSLQGSEGVTEMRTGIYSFIFSGKKWDFGHRDWESQTKIGNGTENWAKYGLGNGIWATFGLGFWTNC